MSVKPVATVEGLPGEVFGPGNVTWWGALGGEVIEGFVLVVAVFAYAYLWHDSAHWPPLRTPLPSLGIPTVNLGLMLLSVVPATWAYRSARRQNRRQTTLALALHLLIGVTILVLRYFEMHALNVRWNTNAYGSIAWTILFSHGFTTIFDVMETAGLLLLCVRLEPEEKYYVDVAENSFFWYFVVGSWIPLYLLVFWGPRLFPS